MLLPRLAQLAAAFLLVGTVSAHAPTLDMENSSIKRDSAMVAAVAEISDMGFSPRLSPRSLFEKRQYQSCSGSDITICSRTATEIRCCPSGYDCFYSGGDWKCDPNNNFDLGLTRGQKIGIGIGVTVVFILICIAGFVIFFCCCRKAIQVASAAVNNNNNNNNNNNYNNNGAAYMPQPVMYGNQGGYDPAAIPLTHQTPPAGGETKPYADNTGYYPPPPPNGGYDQYGQQLYGQPQPQQGHQQYGQPGYSQPPTQAPYQPAGMPAPPAYGTPPPPPPPQQMH